MISSVTRVSGWTGPGGGRRPGRARSGRSGARGRRGASPLPPPRRAARLLEPGEEGGVRGPPLPAGRVHPDDPQRARAALLLLAPPRGEGARADPGLPGGAVELAPPAEIPLRLLENLLPALAGLG